MTDSKKRKRKNWIEEEEMLLLQLWEESVHELKKSRRNHQLYRQMAEHLAGHTAEEIAVKISNFTQKYRMQKKAKEYEGKVPTWKHYHIVDRIFNYLLKQGIEEPFVIIKEEDCSNEMSYSSSPPPQLLPPPPLGFDVGTLALLAAAASAPPLMHQLPPPSLPESPDSPMSSTNHGIQNAASSNAKRKRPNNGSMQKEALKIAKENQDLLRDQITFSRDAIREQLNMVARSLDLIRESNENSSIFSSKIIEISERQLELESNFMEFMKEVFSKKLKKRRNSSGGTSS